MTTPITQRDAAARKVTDLAPKVTESAAKVTEIARFRPGPCQSCQVRSRRVGMTKVRTGDSPTAVIVFPAIDLKEGQVVRLAEGDMERATVYGDDPVAWVKLFAEAGAEHLHVVDLDGAFAGESRNRAAVERIVEEFPGYVQLGGGIRTPEAVEGWFELGVARVVIGTAALKDPQFVRDMAGEWENGIVVAVDAKGGMVATEGWAEVSDVPVVDLARRFEDAGVASLLFTDIGRDGLLTGCNIEATVDLARRTSLPVIASGGVKGLDDIRMLAIHADEGIEGVITGRAIYDGRLDIAAAIAMAERT